jgi:LysM repeat protein
MRSALALVAHLWICALLAQKDDHMSIGGALDPVEYDLATAGSTAALAQEGGWDVNDSIQHIPSYDLYCGWHTDVIFSNAPAMVPNTCVDLVLSTRADDHAWPVCGAVNSSFGWRHGRPHNGLDLELETGDAVVAAFDGMVRISEAHGSFGQVVVVRHPNGLETLYAHLSERLVQVGDKVGAGERIGLGGSTGRSTGSHLHFEVRYLGVPIDPQQLFDVESGDLHSRELAITMPATKSAEKMSQARVAKYHTVRKGETLSAIARKRGTTIKVLCKLNKLRSPDSIKPGQRLRYS